MHSTATCDVIYATVTSHMSIQSGPWAFHRLNSTELDNEQTLVLYGEGGGKRDEDTAKLESKYKAVSELLFVHAVMRKLVYGKRSS